MDDAHLQSVGGLHEGFPWLRELLCGESQQAMEQRRGDQLGQGFSECWRVLKPEGTLVFKWNETQIPISKILPLAPARPLFGQRCGKSAKTHWMIFLKQNTQANPPEERGSGSGDCSKEL